MGRAYTKTTLNVSKVSETGLAAGLRLDPLVELSAPSGPISRNGCQGREHSLAAVRSALRRRWVTEVRVSGRRLIRRASGQNACLTAGLRPNLMREPKRSPDFIFRPQMHQKRLASGLRPDPLRELSAPPDS